MYGVTAWTCLINDGERRMNDTSVYVGFGGVVVCMAVLE
jgi:hypothetical protein